MHVLTTHLEKWQVKSTVFVSQGIICRFSGLLLLQRFNLYFILVLVKLMLLVDAIFYQAPVPGKFSPCALQKEGDCYIVFLISPLILRL